MTGHHYAAALDRAHADLSAAIRARPDFADAYYRRGDVCLARRRYDEAVADYGEAVEMAPGTFTTNSNGVGLGQSA